MKDKARKNRVNNDFKVLNMFDLILIKIYTLQLFYFDLTR